VEKLNKAQIDELISMEKNLDEKLIPELVKIYNEQLGQVAAEVSLILKNENYERLSELAHKLKSSAGNLGLLMPASICLEIEKRSKNKENLDYLREVEGLKKASEEGVVALKSYVDSKKG